MARNVAIGRAINPQLVEAQLEGGAVQGLGFALTEDFTIDHESGRVLTDSLLTYRVPRATEIPEIETILIEDPAAAGPPIRNVRYSAAIEGKADLAGHAEIDAYDPSATSADNFCWDARQASPRM